MDVAWVVVGVLLLVVTLLDAFLAVLNYDEAGPVVSRLVRVQWLVLRAVTRRVGRRWRPVVLRQVTGILIVVTILWWVAGIVVGFTLIYYGAMGMPGVLVTSAGVERDLLGALYLSLGQFSTVGVDNIGPAAAALNLVTVAEALVSVVLLSFIITFLGSVYGVIQSLQSLSAKFFRAGRGITDPIESLTPFFPEGRARGLDAQLDAILDSLTAYGHGLSQNRAAYYFQSGRDQFALPFSIYMTAGVIGALRWGLPTGSDPSTEPGLLRLTDAFEEFRVRLQRALHWAPGAVPAAVTAEEFEAAVATFERADPAADLDPWVARFLTVDRRMAALTHSGAPIDRADAYRRYAEWLPFEFQAQFVLAAVSRDLDYQPIYRRIATTADGVPIDGPDGGYELLPVELATPARASAPAPMQGAPPQGESVDASERAPRRTGSWLRRRGLFVDPGLVRLASAGRTIAGVLVAIALGVTLATLIGASALDAAVLAGLIALFASPAAIGTPSSGHRWVGLVAVVPTAIGVAIGGVLPRDHIAAGVAMALIAAAAVWLRRFGARAGGLGQLGFIAYYFALMLDLDPGTLPAALAAAGIGLLCSWAAALLPGPSFRRQIDGAVAAMNERVAYLLETVVDLVSSARGDARLLRALRRQQRAVQKTASTIAGYLDGTDAPALAPDRARVLRIRVFDLQLAADNLVSLVPSTEGVGVTSVERARLAAELVAARAHLEGLPRTTAADDPATRAELPAVPTDATRFASAIVELRVAADQLHAARSALDRRDAPGADAPAAATPAPAPQPTAEERSPDTAAAQAAASVAGSGGAPYERQALQAGLSTGLALLFGSFVSTSHQYWAAMPAFSVLSGSDGETRMKAAQRILATLLGATIAFSLAILADHNPAVAFPLLAVSVFFIAFLRPVASAWASFWQTLLLATMYDVLGTLSVETVQVRIVETAIGALVAVVISAIVLPTRTRGRVRRGMADVVGAAGVIAHAALGDSAPQNADDDPQRALTQRLTALEDLARPLRSNPGALRRDGIEAQLTAVWSIAYDVRRIASERTDASAPAAGTAPSTAPDSAAPSSALRRRLDVATADNFAAAQAVLTGALPRRLQAPEDLAAAAPADAPEAVRSLVLRVIRLNQALLALVEALKPGTVEAMTAGRSTPQPLPVAAHRD